MSLVYEVVWARLLAVHLGSTTEGHTLVIATFMGGLGLGYAWLGRHADKVSNPLRLYASLELGITLWALALPWLIDVTSGLLGGGLALSVVAVAVPTTLMGGTLPALTAALAQRDAPGKTIAGLYGINALGAAIGVFVAGFWLIESLGVRGAGFAAAGVNGALALTAWVLSLGAQKRREVAPPPLAFGPLVRWACASACVVGLVSMALQGAWIRLFAVVLGSSSYSFTLVIGVYILGMAIGSLLVRPLMSKMAPLVALSSLAVVTALVLWLSAPWFSALPFELAGLREALYGQGASFAQYTATRLGLVAGLIMLPTLAFGASLPLCAQVAAVGRPGAGTGTVFAWNTVGAVLGAATSLPILVGLWGLDGVHQAGALTLALLGLVLGLLVTGSRVKIPLAALGLIAIIGPLIVPVSWDPREVSAGAFRMRERKAETREEFRERIHKSQLLFHADGPDATVCVLERKSDRVMMVNGKPDASTRGDMVTQVMSAHVPLLLHPEPKTALVVGLGSGVTVGSALHHPDLTVDVVEVSQAVCDASRYFDAVSGGPLDDPRVTLITDDVRSALRRREEARWDVIISEPSNPWVAGNAGLFSVDYFELLSRHLAQGGVAAQWVQRYETDDATLTMVIRSFAEVFAHVEVWQLYPTDLLLVGHRAPPTLDIEKAAARLARPEVAQDLTRVRVPGLAGLLSLQAMTHEGVSSLLSAPGLLNTDDRPVLEFEGPRRLYAGARAELVSDHDVRVGRSASKGHYAAAQPREDIATLQGLFAFHTTYPGAPEAFRLAWLKRLVAESDAAFLIQLLFTIEAEARWDWVMPISERILALAPDLPKALYVVARAQMAWDKAMGSKAHQSTAEALLSRCITLGDEPRGRCAQRVSR